MNKLIEIKSFETDEIGKKKIQNHLTKRKEWCNKMIEKYNNGDFDMFFN